MANLCLWHKQSSYQINFKLNSLKFLREKLGPFIELFQLEEEYSREANVQSSLEDGLKTLKEVADLMKDRKESLFLNRAKVSTRYWSGIYKTHEGRF